ncbi:hypothetical protein PLICRDRAFT_41437 [Plicaturopsis crispa FD-325 SS-3]|nr:hypothetical protein PLICRDRAFT_41437 [Plicaturopsis crispa FD-325 SS-3]
MLSVSQRLLAAVQAFICCVAPCLACMMLCNKLEVVSMSGQKRVRLRYHPPKGFRKAAAGQHELNAQLHCQ